MLGLEKDRGDSPPSYDSTGQARLNDTSHGVTLSITPPERGWFVPGETVRPTLHIPNDVLGSVEGEVQCSLEGKSSVEVMGKQRYQKAQMLQASLGSNPVPIAGRDDHIFALVSTSVPRPESFGRDATHTLELAIPERRTCDCAPSKSGDGVIPSIGWRGSLGERNRVKWKVRVQIRRKGVLKRDIKLAIEIPVSLPSPGPSKSPLTSSQSKALKYKAAEGVDQASSSLPELETTLTVLPGSRDRLPFRVHLCSPLIPIDDSLHLSVGLCKHTWTKGIHTSLGSDKGHDFPGIMVGSIKLGSPDSERGVMEVTSRDQDGWVVDGEYRVEEGSVTALGCAIRLSWSLQAQVRWNKLDSPMVVAQLIHLPHHSAV